MPKAQKAIYSCKSVPNENDLWKVYAVVAAPFFLGAASVPEPKSPKKHHINKTMAKTHNQQIPNPKKTMIENLNRELYDRKRWKHLLWSHSWNGEARYASISSCQFRWSFCGLPWRSSYLKSLIINQSKLTIPNINPNEIIEEEEVTFPSACGGESTSGATTLLEMEAAAATPHTESVSLVPSLTKTPCSLPLRSIYAHVSNRRII